MLIGEIGNSGAIPVLEAAVRFAGARQRMIAHNVANISTPEFIQQDVSPLEFQRVLRKAVDERRSETGGAFGNLDLPDSRQIKMDPGGNLRLTPMSPSGNILFHDRNNRDLERLMQDNAENVGAYRIAMDLLRSRFEVLRSAIAERP